MPSGTGAAAAARATFPPSDPPTEHGDDEGTAGGRRPAGGLPALGEQTGVVDHVGECGRQLTGGERIMHRAIAVHPDPVEELRDPVDADLLPFGAGDLGVVEHLAQAEHEGDLRLDGPERAERLDELAVHPERVPVDDDDVGAEGIEGTADDRGADVEEPVRADREGARLVPALALADPGHDDPVEPLGAAVGGGGPLPGDEEAGHGAAGEPGQGVGERLGDRQVATGVAQSQRVVGVERDPQLLRAEFCIHRRSLTFETGVPAAVTDVITL